MEWWQKISVLVKQRGMTYAAVERGADWPSRSLKVAIREKRNIGVSLGLGLARAVEVPMEWLFDPKLDMPAPPIPALSSEEFADGVIETMYDLLRREVVRRARENAERDLPKPPSDTPRRITDRRDEKHA